LNCGGTGKTKNRLTATAGEFAGRLTRDFTDDE
jgi:hypothetical protein